MNNNSTKSLFREITIQMNKNPDYDPQEYARQFHEAFKKCRKILLLVLILIAAIAISLALIAYQLY